MTENDDVRRMSRLVKRQRILLVVTTLAALLAVGALGVSLLVKSPAQRVADKQPPAPSEITAEVTQEKLTRTLVVRGRVAATAVDITAMSTAASERLVLTGLPVSVGSKVQQGSVVAQLSGRPLMVWQSAVPFYRDIKPGMAGPDVDALRAAMAAAGKARAGAPGRPFDVSLQRSVAAHYKAAGYTALTMDDLNPGAKAERQAAQRAVLDAQRAVKDAPDATAKARAKEDLALAQQTRDDITGGVVLPVSEIAAVPTLPAVVSAVKAVTGADMSASSDHVILSIASGTPVVQATAPLGEKASLAVGQEVQVDDEISGTTTACTIASIKAATPSSGGSDQMGTQGEAPTELVLVLKPKTPIKNEHVGNEARAAISLKSTGDDVLTVPLNAVRSSDDGKSKIVVLDASGARRDVPVTVGMATETRVEIHPSGSVSAGDKVLVL